MMSKALCRVSDFAEKQGLLPRGSRVLVCISGGADSVALLHMLLSLVREREMTLFACHYNHSLRGPESDGDEAFVRSLCRRLEVPLEVGSGDVAARARERGLGIEECAREMRYEFFDRAAAAFGCDAIATAHNADDNLETLVFHLARGSGLKGLGGIPPRRGNIVRPLLCLTRAEIEEYLRENGLAHREDSTNASDDYARNLIRHRVLPVLRELNPRASEAALRTSLLLRKDEEFLNGMAAELIGGRDYLSAAELASCPEPVALRAVRQLGGEGMSAGHVRSVLALAAGPDPSGSVNIPGAVCRREYDRLFFERPEAAPEGFKPFTIAPGQQAEIPALGLTVTCETVTAPAEINKSFTTFLFKTASLCGIMTIRPRNTGDGIRLSPRSGRKSLKKLFIEKKIPSRRRALVPVVSDDMGVLAVYGIGSDARSFAAPGDAAIKISFNNISREKQND